MWTEPQNNGTIRFREEYKDPITGKIRKVGVTKTRNTNQTRKAAQSELDQLIEKKIQKILDDHQRSTNPDITFSDLIDKWLANYKTIRKEATYYQRKNQTKNLPQKILDTMLTDLTFAQLNNFLFKLKRDGYSKSTVNNYYSLLRLILAFGLTLGDVKDRGLLDNMIFPEFKKETNEEDLSFLEPLELQGVIQQLKDRGFPEIARLCAIQAQTGLRYGELVGLDYEKHINMSQQTISVERTYVSHSNTFNAPKNGSTRVISFNNSTKKLLQEQIQFTRFKTMQLGLNKEPLLFKSQTGHPIPNQTANYPLKRYVEIPNKEVRTHIFRHTFIARMTEQGTPIELIAEHVGHKSTRIIMQFYSHFTQAMNDQLTNEVNRVEFGL